MYMYFVSLKQEEDLNCVRERWSEALIKRKEYLDEHIQKIINKQGLYGGLFFHRISYMWAVNHLPTACRL